MQLIAPVSGNLSADVFVLRQSGAGRATPVKNQGTTCASCWVAAAQSAVEMAMAIVYPMSSPPPFSRQEIVDCANFENFGRDFITDIGCDGGSPADALAFMSTFTIPMESVYQYTSGITGTWSAADCKLSMLSLPLSDTTWMMAGGFYNISLNQGNNNEVVLMRAVSVQPIVVLWNMGSNFNSYAGGGIYSISMQNDPVNGCMNDPDYTNTVLLAVGYINTPNTTNVWILQNRYVCAYA